MEIGKESGTADKSRNKLRKRAQKRQEEKEKGREDAVVDVEMGDVMTLGKKDAKSKPKREGGKEKALHKLEGDDDEDGESEVEAQEDALQHQGKSKGKGKGKDVQAFQQRELVARAFAGDNVVRVR